LAWNEINPGKIKASKARFIYSRPTYCPGVSNPPRKKILESMVRHIPNTAEQENGGGLKDSKELKL